MTESDRVRLLSAIADRRMTGPQFLRRERQKMYSKKALRSAQGGDEGGPYTKQKSGYSHSGDRFGEKSPAVERHKFLKRNPGWR